MNYEPRNKVYTKVDKAGRVLIPAAMRRAMQINPNQELIVHFPDGGIHIYTKAVAIRRAQEYVRSLVPAGVSLVDELIQERREEAARESHHSG